jgi:hypothetical protein
MAFAGRRSEVAAVAGAIRLPAPQAARRMGARNHPKRINIVNTAAFIIDVHGDCQFAFR